jgi:hypothetical protein
MLIRPEDSKECELEHEMGHNLVKCEVYPIS